MSLDKNKCLIFTALTAIFLSFLAFLINFLFFKFSGNNYFPDGTVLTGIILLLVLFGCSLLFEKDNACYLIARELFYFFLVMAMIATMTNAAQYTPFPPIDEQIIAFEALFGIDMAKIISWTAQFPLFKQILVYIYKSIDYQMGYLPILLIFLLRLSEIREYYFLVLFSAVIGFSFYYFFPTIAPASMVESPLFFDAQHATGIKFMEIHNHQPPSTIEGGMIALPSFHAIWAWFCLYLCRKLKVLFLLLLPVNLLLIASCVLLGWHYPVDIAAAVVLALLTHGMYYLCKRSKLRN
ncbi:phosphatase PAP2 family protein [Legionella spiritensis]|uniref:phosphatase PAP2 family protein n=1 Tax=Legionella spiritensis TaxID=452 RepID=UPI000F6C140D|nr:phosphatase PAP2 family protein [Legionella spiritensis]VEG89961.1 PAP2 superfamily [Legionella spiritensis]